MCYTSTLFKLNYKGILGICNVRQKRLRLNNPTLILAQWRAIYKKPDDDDVDDDDVYDDDDDDEKKI